MATAPMRNTISLAIRGRNMAPLTVFAMLNPIAAAAAAGIINSIQVVSITMANGVTSASATITSAQTANTMLVWNSQYLGTPTTPTNGLDQIGRASCRE